MLEIKNKQIIIDGCPLFLLSGELHYFRQPRTHWRRLLDEARALGLNCIAAYVPWILHEEYEGEYCFSDNLDLGAFIDLCTEYGFLFLVRPGPFIMAEMKGEGIPYWVAEKHPDSVPIGFDGIRRPTTTLDYLNPGFLSECKKWYTEIMKLIVPRLHCNGGNIIGVQLDNEIGMLQWVGNYPLFTDNALNKFILFLKETYGNDELLSRYDFLAESLDTESLDSGIEYIFKRFRSPQESYAAALHIDFGLFMRRYYAEYAALLAEYARDCGVRDTPFYINIHGTGNDRIFDYPLGISQLYEAYNKEGFISGTDVYLGEPNEGKYQDMYVVNALTDCMNKKGNPLTSIEFQCSDGGYARIGKRFHPSATSHKMLICLSQNARLINFYLFSGGENYFLKNKRPDGNYRMAFTGQEHGMSALVRPDGIRGYSFDHVAKTARAISVINEQIASAKQILDNVTLGFIPDMFLTELSYQKSEAVAAIHQSLKKWRCETGIDSVARALLRRNISFDATDITDTDVSADRLLVIFSARYMPEAAQDRLKTFVEKGGLLLLYGELPEYDLEGRDCRVLQNALNLPSPTYIENNPPGFFLTVECVQSYRGTAPDQRCGAAQCFPMDNDAILSTYGNDMMCGMLKKLGLGRICVISCDYPSESRFYDKLFSDFGVKASLRSECETDGVYLTRSAAGECELLYIINLDSIKKTVRIIRDDDILFDELVLFEKASYILPLNLCKNGVEIVKSTAELSGFDADSMSFRLSQPRDVIVLKTERAVLSSEDYEIFEGTGTLKTIYSKKHALVDDNLIIKLGLA